jgi:hypothetical protein
LKKICLNHITWRCIVSGCKSSGKTVLNYLENLNSFVPNAQLHNHEHSLDYIIKTERRNEMKAMIEITSGSVRKVLGRALKGVNTTVLSVVGKNETLSRMLRRHRNATLNPRPYRYPILKLSLNLSICNSGEEFFQFGPENYKNLIEDENFLIFYAASMIERMRREQIYCVDGTFKVVPRPFMQLYTVSFLKRSHVFPVIFGVLKNKKETTYVSFWKTVNSLVGILSPFFIKTDFELASINAIRISFPSAKISGGNFYLGQCILRKLKTESIFNIYKTNLVVKKFVKALTALAFVKKEKVEETFIILNSSSTFPILLQPIYNYFYLTFISETCAVFPISYWHCLKNVTYDIPKTNNAIEAWHNVFGSSFGSSKYNFTLLIEKLKDEQEIIRQRCIRMDIGEEFVKKKFYVEMEHNLKMFIENENEKCGFEYMMRLVDLLYY